MPHRNWTGCATALFQTWENGCDCRRASTQMAKSRRSAAFPLTSEMGERRTRRLVNPDGAPVSLTNGEYALLLAFLKAPQRPLTREMILQATRVREDIFDRSIDVQVLRLRRRLEIDPNAPRIIETERGVGYIFTAMVKPF